jgi:hypothetical protein
MTDSRNEVKDILTTVNIVVEYHTYQLFKKIVGQYNASKEIRAMMKERVLAEQQEQERHERKQTNQEEEGIKAV